MMLLLLFILLPPLPPLLVLQLFLWMPLPLLRMCMLLLPL
jgi:hypothetical protein